MKSPLAAIVVMLGSLTAAAAGCASSSSPAATPATSGASPVAVSPAKNFQVSTPTGQLSLSLDGKLPPDRPSQFPVPSGAIVAGSGSAGGSNSATLVAAYTTAGPPSGALAFYKGNSKLTTSGEKSVSSGERYLGTLEITAPYTGSVTVASRHGTTYIVITLKK